MGSSSTGTFSDGLTMPSTELMRKEAYLKMNSNRPDTPTPSAIHRLRARLPLTRTMRRAQ